MTNRKSPWMPRNRSTGVLHLEISRPLLKVS